MISMEMSMKENRNFIRWMVMVVILGLFEGTMYYKDEYKFERKLVAKKK